MMEPLPPAVLAYYQLHPIPANMSFLVVFFSVVISILGCFTTLLLLGRRTGVKGHSNVLLLLLSSLVMATVAIWGMHFVGMHMTLRPVGGNVRYVRFHPGFTILSLFAPIISLAGSFVFLGSQSNFRPLRALIAGIFVGLTVSLMHFSSSFSASFAVHYKPGFIVASVLISCTASALALVVFFRTRHHWHDSWWKKALCAVGLTGGIAGQHYCALVGTEWRFRKDIPFDANTNNTVMFIAIGVIASVVCIASIALVYGDYIITKKHEAAIREVVVASVAFDKHGRVLVCKDGFLPMKVIESRAALEDILYQLDYRQETFQYLYALSFQWSILRRFMRKIQLYSKGVLPVQVQKSRFNRGTGYSQYHSEEVNLDLRSFSAGQRGMMFVERFIEGVYGLADGLKLEMDQVGRLYDRILVTGTKREETKSLVGLNGKGQGRLMPDDSLDWRSAGEDAEGQDVVQEEKIEMERKRNGVMLFLVRQISEKQQDSVAGYQNGGYRFVESNIMGKVLGERFGIEVGEMAKVARELESYSHGITNCLFEGGSVYVGLFGVRAVSTRLGGVETLVYDFARHQIPIFPLPETSRLDQEIRGWLFAHRGFTTNEILSIISSSSVETESPLSKFHSSLRLSIESLCESLSKAYSNIGDLCRLSLEILDVLICNEGVRETASVILFEGILQPGYQNGIDDHEKMYEGLVETSLMFTPYSLFTRAQTMIVGGSGRRNFEEVVIKDLSPKYLDDETSQVSIEQGSEQRERSGEEKRKLEMGESEDGTSLETSNTGDSGGLKSISKRFSRSIQFKIKEVKILNEMGGLEEVVQDERDVIESRERIDGWFARRMKSLEKGPNGDVLLGVSW